LRWGSGSNQKIPLEIVGTSGASVISGAVPLIKWEVATANNTPQRATSAARGKLWVSNIADIGLPTNVIPSARGFGLPIRPILTEFFVNSEIQPGAAWPNSGFGKLLRAGQAEPDEKKTFAIEGRKVSDWADEPDLQVQAFWGHDWAAQSYLIASKNIAANSLTVFGNGSPYGIKEGQRARVEGALADLDTPGEWYLDRANSNLFYWPPAGFNGSEAEVSVATGLLNIETSAHVLVRNLTFEKTRGDAVTINKSSHAVLDNVVIRLTGNRALVVIGSTASGIRKSLIEDNGEGGVYLSGGNRATLQPSSNFVDGNIIRRFSRLVKTYRFAVDLAGVGQQVTNNTISDAPHTAIFFKGNDHLIGNNEIFNVVRESSDSGAIYVGRDFVAHGTVIENNYFHDITYEASGREVKGIYIDDQASGVTVRGNIFARVQQPVFLGGGRDNVIEKNLFFHSSPAVHLDARGLTFQKLMTLDPKGVLQLSLDAVPYREAMFAARFPNLHKIREDDIGAPKYNVFRNNTVIGGLMSQVTKDALTGIAIIENKLSNESIFVKPMAKQDRVLREDFQIFK
jgi:hypothetical protein